MSSLSDKVLFKTGSYNITNRAKEILGKVATVINGKPDFEALVEGHTDNVPYKGNAQLSSNWDLSTKRATSIVKILKENSSINPENLTAAGRGEFAPIASNKTAEGKAKNRRIEVILTPKLDEISKLLNEI